jgi:hypothetical protein
MKMLLISAGGALLSAPVVAAQTAQTPAVVASVIDCRSETSEAARLRCYDAAAAGLAQATSAGTIVFLDREAVTKTRRSLFGFDMPDLPFFKGKGQEEAPKEIVARIVSAQAAGFQNWLLALDSGGTWQTTEPTPNLSMPRPGDQVRIKKSAGGGYMLQIGSRNIRTRRVR